MKARRGQSTVETMLLVSVVSIAMGAVLIVFSDMVQVSGRALSSSLAKELTGQAGGQQVH